MFSIAFPSERFYFVLFSILVKLDNEFAVIVTSIDPWYLTELHV